MLDCKDKYQQIAIPNLVTNFSQYRHLVVDKLSLVPLV